MATNPNPARITDELWRFVEECLALEPGSDDVNAGTITNKPGYHGTREWNQANAPGNYSIRDAEDLGGPGDKTAAFDWTFRSAQAGNYDRIMIYAGRLLRSGQDPDDPRGNGMREFYGQADKDTAVEGWDFRYVGPRTSDASHLWHIHFSFDRDKVNDRATFDAVLSILRGETVAQWRGQEDDVLFTVREPATGSIWLCDFMSRRGITTEAEWKRLLVWGASGKLGSISHLGDLPATESIDWYGTRIDDAETIVLTEEQVAELLAGVNAAIAKAPKPLTEAQTVAAVVKGANIAEDS